MHKMTSISLIRVEVVTTKLIQSVKLFIFSFHFITDEGILNCSTINGTNPDALCIFPFKHNGVTYRQCTIDGNAEGDITPWCSTLVDGSGEHIGEGDNWGNCGPDCSIYLSSK